MPTRAVILDVEMKNSDRRQFLGICLGGLATSAAVAVAYPIYRYLSPLQENSTASRVRINETDLKDGEAKFFQYAGSAAVLLKKKKMVPIALSAVCSHLGCIVQWHDEQQEFICPCHAGRYDAEGAVISGPPPKPLQRLPVAIANGTITIG